MPRSSKRAKVAQATELGDLPDSQTQGNASYLTSVPDEIFLEIISWFPQPPPLDIAGESPQYFIDHHERFEILHPLSQTCQKFRAICLPLAWERLEACLTMNSPRDWPRGLGMMLERKSKGLLETNHLHPYVK